jgi:hypothetical protein
MDVLCQYMKDVVASEATPYKKLLHALYIINDLLFNGNTITFKGHYTKLCSLPNLIDPEPILSYIEPFLPWIYQTTYRTATSDSERDQLSRMLSIWQGKSFIPDTLKEKLFGVMTEPIDVSYPILDNFVSPYPITSTSKKRNFSTMSSNTFLTTQRIPPPVLTTPALLPFSGVVPALDLNRCSVGVMATIVKASLKINKRTYIPISPEVIAKAPPTPPMEKGRLDARVAEFYRKLEHVST